MATDVVKLGWGQELQGANTTVEHVPEWCGRSISKAEILGLSCEPFVIVRENYKRITRTFTTRTTGFKGLESPSISLLL